MSHLVDEGWGEERERQGVEDEEWRKTRLGGAKAGWQWQVPKPGRVRDASTIWPPRSRVSICSPESGPNGERLIRRSKWTVLCTVILTVTYELRGLLHLSILSGNDLRNILRVFFRTASYIPLSIWS